MWENEVLHYGTASSARRQTHGNRQVEKNFEVVRAVIRAAFLQT